MWDRSKEEDRWPDHCVNGKKKDIEKGVNELAHIVGKPRFICKDCARAAHAKSFLCKAVKLPLS